MQSIKKVVFVGSGNVATALAHGLVDQGFDILQIYSPNMPHAALLANGIGCPATDQLQALNQEADIYIIAVKDDAIAQINHKLRLPGKIVVHTSGAAPLMAIQQVSDKTGVLYPLQTFSKNRPIHWQNVPLCIEASDIETGQILREFAEPIGGSVFEIDSQARAYLHLAAVFANNFTNFLLGQAKEIMGEKLPFNILEPLVQETVDKAFDLGPDAAQTGPAVRHDQKTIAHHLELLKNSPKIKELYEIMTGFINDKYPMNSI